MQGGRDPFSNFGNPFGSFGGSGGFGGQRSLLSGFFGGRDPFDDPFFTNPFGGMFGSSPFGPRGGPFGSIPFGPGGGPFMDSHMSGFLEQQPSVPFQQPPAPFQQPRSRGPVIEELDSDDEKEEKDISKEKKQNSRKHARPRTEAFVEYPDDEAGERKSKQMVFQRANNEQQPQVRSFSFQSSTVSYGGANGTYYTSSKTRRTGSDGLMFEESKEANSATGQANHRVSRGIHNKGHSLLRKLDSDGRVDTMQTLHNLNENELDGFEETWKGKARNQLPGLYGGFNLQGDAGSGSSVQNGANRGGWALPSTEGARHSGNLGPEVGNGAGPSHPKHSSRPKTDAGNMMGSSKVATASNMEKARKR
ncbi:unnamed protein product [Withania somnifera]